MSIGGGEKGWKKNTGGVEGRDAVVVIQFRGLDEGPVEDRRCEGTISLGTTYRSAVLVSHGQEEEWRRQDTDIGIITHYAADALRLKLAGGIGELFRPRNVSSYQSAAYSIENEVFGAFQDF